MRKKRKILIITPGLNYLGGTELETLITAKLFLENNITDEIVIFSPLKASKSVAKYYNDSKIKYWNYPQFFLLSWVQRLDSKFRKIFKLFNWNFSPLQYVYWRIITIFYKFKFNYVITDSAQFYYAPALINFKLDVTLIKFTNCFLHTKWQPLQQAILKQCNIIIVTAENQKIFLSNKFKVINVDVVDVFTWNENRLFKIREIEAKKYTFGMLCRLSEQKKIQDGILLIKRLKDLGIQANLLVKGPSKDENYLTYLLHLIKELNVQSNIIIDDSPLQPFEIPTFFDKVKFFLITSSYEGGPNTGLESMAAAVPVLSYEVGAMPERLEPFSDWLIAEDMQDLVDKAIFLIKMDNAQYSELSRSLRKHYLKKFSNKSVLSHTLKYIKTN